MGEANVSITSILKENEKQIYQVKAINSIPKRENDLIDDFISIFYKNLMKLLKKKF